jgi:long-chain acyl-CoA synthetase
VPRLYENMQERLNDFAAKMPERRRGMFAWALRIGTLCAGRRREGRRIGPLLAAQHAIADRLVLSKVREKIGAKRTRFFVTGGAPMNPSTGAFFEALGVRLLEGYGLTECPVISLNRPGQARLGTVGPPLPGMEVKIAPDGEILARGPSLMRGYFGRPEDTAEAIDSDGWFHTGDIGEMTPDGMLKITDRKKDIIVLANGKNVAPQPIEARLKESPYIAEIVLIGDRQNAIVAIVVPAFDRLKAWAKQNELSTGDLPALLRRAETRKLFKDEIDRLSERLADFERVKRFTLLDHPFSIEGGELTPTLKVKRKFIAQKYAAEIEQMVR